MIRYTYKPTIYYFTVLLITYISCGLAAYFSYSERLNAYQIPFILIGMLTPFTVAMFMIYGSKNTNLKNDFQSRLLNIKLVKKKYWLIILSVMPITLLLATSVSLLFNQPIDQFFFVPELFSTGGEFVIILIILLLAPTFEEIGWRGYGVDSLKNGRSVFKATVIFAILWNAWHWPLFFINGYYQNELFHMNLIYAANFVISIFPAAFIMNWIYYKNNRSIIAIIVFHIMLNLFSVMFQTEQITKCIITVLLIILVIIVILNDKKFFFNKP